MKSTIVQLRRLTTRLNSRERVLVGVSVVAILVTGIYLVIDSTLTAISESERLGIVRTRQLSEIHQVSKRYQVLNARLNRVKQTFADSQLTFEEVTDKLDKIVQDSIGSRNYDLNRGKTSKVGLDYDKQDITVKLKSITLEQSVKLLHRLEQGDTPLFLGKVDMLKSPSDNTFSATLEIFSIRKS